MKKYYIILLVFYMTYWANAQNEPCPPTGVTTNPQNPQNPQSPFYTNHFDWTAPFYDVFFEGGNTTTMGNPYASNQGAMRDLDEGDTYFHEDGWELVFVDFGLNRSGQPLASGEGPSRARWHRVRIVGMSHLNNYEIKVPSKRATSALERGLCTDVFILKSLY